MLAWNLDVVACILYCSAVLSMMLTLYLCCVINIPFFHFNANSWQTVCPKGRPAKAASDVCGHFILTWVHTPVHKPSSIKNSVKVTLQILLSGTNIKQVSIPAVEPAIVTAVIKSKVLSQKMCLRIQTQKPFKKIGGNNYVFSGWSVGALISVLGLGVVVSVCCMHLFFWDCTASMQTVSFKYIYVCW